jgi:LacI family transcriptional regulator
VVSFDDTALSILVRPTLSTVATPTSAAGRAAVDLLLQQDIQARSGRGAAQAGPQSRRTNAHMILRTVLIPRDSSGPAPPGALTAHTPARPAGRDDLTGPPGGGGEPDQARAPKQPDASADLVAAPAKE